MIGSLTLQPYVNIVSGCCVLGAVWKDLDVFLLGDTHGELPIAVQMEESLHYNVPLDDQRGYEKVDAHSRVAVLL